MFLFCAKLVSWNKNILIWSTVTTTGKMLFFFCACPNSIDGATYGWVKSYMYMDVGSFKAICIWEQLDKHLCFNFSTGPWREPGPDKPTCIETFRRGLAGKFLIFAQKIKAHSKNYEFLMVGANCITVGSLMHLIQEHLIWITLSAD